MSDTVVPLTVVDGRFVVERLAGAGGTAHVYAAMDQHSHQRVALKVGPTGADLSRFEEEALVLEGLRHPSIVRYIAHGVHGGASFLAMEWLEGEDLATLFERERLSLEQILS